MASRTYGLLSSLRPIVAAGTVATTTAWTSTSRTQESQKNLPSVVRQDVNISNREWLQIAEVLLDNDKLGDTSKRKQLATQICRHVQSQIPSADTSKKRPDKSVPSANTTVDPKRDFHLSLSMSEFFPTQQHLLHQALRYRFVPQNKPSSHLPH
eukprot:gb/GECG01000491.1/.p1 GENE.gb/GECG01000491.1/~~gb/GECG01000491.1/.p1  ORF type:complete len:154 (+),score=17.17 gb/GECG01000491.1/:1-462(+)